MAELFITEILASFGVVSLITFIIFVELRKKKKYQSINERGRELIRTEKELDRNAEIERSQNTLT
jgi:hypothetical protein